MGDGEEGVFDEHGRLELVLSIGHRTFPVDKRQRRIQWRVFVSSEAQAIISEVEFTVLDGLSAAPRGETIRTAPFEIERTSSPANEAIEVAIEVRYKPSLGAPPTVLTHEVVLKPAGRGGTEEKFVVLQDPKMAGGPAIVWEPYEAQPGEYVAKARHVQNGRGPWGGGGGGGAQAVGKQPAPSHRDFAAFPSLGGKKPNLSFASALAGANQPSHAKPPGLHSHPLSQSFSMASEGPQARRPVATARTLSAPCTPPSRVFSEGASPPSIGGPCDALPDVTEVLAPPQNASGALQSASGASAERRTPSRGGSGAAGAPLLGAAPSGAAGSSAASANRQRALVATGNVDAVQRWLVQIGLADAGPAFLQHAIDGKTLISLTEDDLEKEMKITRGRRRLLCEIQQIQAAVPPPAPPPVRRLPSEPMRGYSLHDDIGELERQQVTTHVANSNLSRDGGDGQPGAGAHRPDQHVLLEVIRVQRVVNSYLEYMLEKTSRGLCSPGTGRSLPPQGGYFHGTDRDSCLGIIEHGFDDSLWRGGKFGVGQYLSMDASKAAAAKYTKADGHLLLCEAVLGRVWHLRRHETDHSLNATRVKAAGYDSLAVPESNEVVVYLRFQAIPRYMIHFRRVELPPHPPSTPREPMRSVSFHGGKYVQTLRKADQEFGVACTRAAAVEVSNGRDVFLKLVSDQAAASREAEALRRVGRSFAPELIDTFELEELGIVLVLEAALLGASLQNLCRRNCVGSGAGSHSGSFSKNLGALAHTGRGAGGGFGGSFDGDGGAVGGASGGGASGGRGFGSRTGSCDLLLEGGLGSIPSSSSSEYLPGSSGGLCSEPQRWNSLHLLADAQQVLQCVNRVHAVGLVHCDIKPEHFMRFPDDTLRLVDFGSCREAYRYCQPGHSRRYVAPEVARAILRAEAGGHSSELRLDPAMDMWAVGLVLFELFSGVPKFSDNVTYREIADARDSLSLRDATDGVLGEAHGRLLSSVLQRDPSQRPSASELLNKKVFLRADDTAERKRIEIVGFFSNPRGTDNLHLMRELKALFDVHRWGRKRLPVVIPAACLSDISKLLATEYSPLVLAFSGHTRLGAVTSTTTPPGPPPTQSPPPPPAGLGGDDGSLDGRVPTPPTFVDQLVFEVEADADQQQGLPYGLRPPVAEPTLDEMIRLLSPALAPELKGLVLNACKTERMASHIQRELRHLSIVCWATVVEDRAAKTFIKGFYDAIAAEPEGACSVARAFEAGRAAFLQAGFREGDPEEYLHDARHDHITQRRFVRTCTGCKPPVHGRPVLVAPTG